jgi:hypothetical protein
VGALRPLLGFVVGVAAAGFGCGGPAIERMPTDTLRAYVAAVTERRLADAYALLSDDAKRSLPFEAFERAVLDGGKDFVQKANDLARPVEASTIRASVVLASGERLELVLEEGRWRIAAGAIDSYSQATPRAAVESFLRALERKRYDVLLRLVPDAERDGPLDLAGQLGVPTLTEAGLKAAWEGEQRAEIEAAAMAIRAALVAARFDETGDVASMSYGPGATVSLVREHGVWRIRDF